MQKASSKKEGSTKMNHINKGVKKGKKRARHINNVITLFENFGIEDFFSIFHSYTFVSFDVVSNDWQKHKSCCKIIIYKNLDYIFHI